MAAATLLFGRVVLPSCNSRGCDPAVRRFVRLSMGGQLDEAQGPEWNGACPNIPRAIKQYYSSLRTNHATTYMYRSNRVYKNAQVCALVGKCPDLPMTDGGHPQVFLTALLWAAGVPCIYVREAVNADESTWKMLHKRWAHMTLQEYVRNSVENQEMSGGWVVSNFVVKNAANRYFRNDPNRLRALLDSVHAAGGVRGVMISIRSTARGVGHSVGVYPCTRDGRLAWILCNTWGEPCTSGNFPDELRTLMRSRDYDALNSISFLIDTRRR